MAGSTPARRLATRARDPRVLAGVLLVLGSTLLGAWLFATADDSVEYWTVARPVRAGDPVTAADLVIERAVLHGDAASTHLRSSDEFPAKLADLVWAADQPAGSFVGDASFDEARTNATVELPLSVAWGDAPDDLAPGDRVDVWVGPGQGASGIANSSRVVDGVRVVSVGEGSAATAGTINRTIVVAVEPAELTESVMTLLSSGVATAVRIP